MMKAAITMLDLGYDFEHELCELNDLGLHAEYIKLEGTDDAKEVGAALKGYSFVLAGPELWSNEALNLAGDQLRMIVRLGTGVDRVDIRSATKRGIAVCNTPGANACAVAQHALAFMLNLSMGVARYDRALKFHKPYERKMSRDLIGKTVGLMGFGKIAAQLAKLLSGFDCKIVAYDIYRNEDLAEKLGVRFVDLSELLIVSDYISVHLPLTDDTKRLCNKEFFNSMKPSAYFINTARGDIVKEDDLLEALKTGMIAGAGLDVFEKPLDEKNELIRLNSVIATPYVAFSSELGQRRTMDMAITSIKDYLKGRKITNLLNPDYIENMGISL